jgi:superfamily I DNA/RNA helicase
MSSEPWLDRIDGDALPELILSDAPVIRVIAGPGSGKTLGLKRRIRRLVEGDGIEPNRIFVGTFTRAIASELARELGSPIDYEEQEADGETREPVVSTLHSLALRMLKESPQAVPGRHFRFLLSFEAEPP